jgi:SAM-dependent methyltransferase
MVGVSDVREPRAGSAVDHWQAAWRAGRAHSWDQETATASLNILQDSGFAPDQSVIDVGGGDSPLAGDLLQRGARDVTVLDISAEALRRARASMGQSADDVAWIRADVLTWRPDRVWAVWHDRAVFHFLTRPEPRRAYIARLHRATAPGSLVMLATFAEDGPTECSGLPTARYGAEQLAHALGPGFAVISSTRERHITPSGQAQPFTWLALRATA